MQFTNQVLYFIFHQITHGQCSSWVPKVRRSASNAWIPHYLSPKLECDRDQIAKIVLNHGHRCSLIKLIITTDEFLQQFLCRSPKSRCNGHEWAALGCNLCFTLNLPERAKQCPLLLIGLNRPRFRSICFPLWQNNEGLTVNTFNKYAIGNTCMWK